jgi:hypothetical protein
MILPHKIFKEKWEEAAFEYQPFGWRPKEASYLHNSTPFFVTPHPQSPTTSFLTAPRHSNCAEMREQLFFTIIRFDKAKTFCIIEPLNNSGRHANSIT